MAGGANLGNEEETISDINVTPFVDVMLVLLIIFMVTANYLNSQAIELDLPEAATGTSMESGDESSSMGFSVSRDSNFYLDGQAISLDQLPAIVEDRRQSGKILQATIAADQATPHGAVIKLIDAIRKNGVTEFAIQVDVESP